MPQTLPSPTFPVHYSVIITPLDVMWAGTATRYGPDGAGIGCRWGARFSAPILTGRTAHPVSYTVSTGSFVGGNAAGSWRSPPTLN